MSTIDEVINYYDPSDEGKSKRMVPGIYPCHIIKCDVKENIAVRNKYRAKIFNYRVKIHEEAKNHKYEITNIAGAKEQVTGEGYIGYEVRSAGVFNFIAPGPEDSFEPNPSGNKRYLDFVNGLGIECPEKEIEINGEKKVVKVLPNVEEADCLGSPVMAVINYGKPWKDKDGNQRTSLEVKSITQWKEGSTIDVELEDLPF